MIEVFRKTVFSLCFFFFLVTVAFAAELSKTSPTAIRLDFLDQHSIPCPGLKRCLVMDPSIITVLQKSDNRVTVKATRVGKTSLVLWGAGLRQTISIEVISPSIPVSQQTERLQREQEEKHAVAFQVDYSFLKDNQNAVDNAPSQSSMIQHTGVRMDTPFIKKTRLGLSGEWNKEKTIQQTRFVSGSVSNISWPESQKYAVTFGNIGFLSSGGGAFSDAGVLKGVQAGDFQWAVSDKDYVNFDVTYGIQDKSPKNRFQNSKSNTFFLTTPGTAPSNLVSGDKIVEKKLVRSKWRYSSSHKDRQIFELNPSSLLEVTRVFEDDKNSLDPSTLFQWDINLTDPRRAVTTSLGGTPDAVSYSGSYQQIIQEFQFKLYHQNVPANTQSVNQTLFERKVNQLTLNYKPKADFFFLKNNVLTWDILQDNQENSTLETREENKLLTQRLEYQGGWEKYTLTLQGRKLDGTKSQNPQVATDYRLSLGRPFHLWRSGFWNVFYSHLKTDQEEISLNSQSDSLGGFIGFRVWKALNYSLSVTSSTTDTSAQEASESVLIGHSLSYYYPLWNNRVQSFIAYSYSTSSAPDEDTVPDIFSSTPVNQDGHSQNLSIGLSGPLSASTSMRVNTQLSSNVQNTGEKRTNSQIEITLSSRFHTLFGWQPKNDIQIVSFIDKDADGKFDNTVDAILPNLEVLVNDKPVGKTNESGELFLPKLRGFQKIISLKREGTPEGYLFSTPSRYEITSQSKTKETCWFGFSINTEISGLVYNDLNQNGLFDDDDEPMPKVSLSLSDGKTTHTDLRGYYYFGLIPEGEYTLQVNVFSLAEGYRSKDKWKRSLRIQKGSVIREDFAFEADRVFKGTVMRKTGAFTQTPIAGVLVTLDGVEKTTDQNGRFKFTKLAAGKHPLRFISIEAPQEWNTVLLFKNKPEIQDQLFVLE
jgi:hypothetical protein